MNNLEISLSKPYQRDTNSPAAFKVSMSAEFASEDEALYFNSSLTKLIIEFRQNAADAFDLIVKE